MATNWTRRRILGAAAAAAAVSAMGAPAPAEAKTAREIDRGVKRALAELYYLRPELRDLEGRAAGVLVIPEIISAGLVIGGSYGEGALRVAGSSASYWSFRAGSFGLQIGAQRSRQALFFMTKEALAAFRAGEGVRLDADAYLTVVRSRDRVDVDEIDGGVVAVEFGESGLLGGASFRGGSYSRISR